MTRNSLFALLLLMSLLFCFEAFGQKGYEDVVYLKNGGEIHGRIEEVVPSESLKIRTDERNLFRFALDDIEKITKEPRHKSLFNKSKGYYGLVEVTFPTNLVGQNFVGITVTNGYRLCPQFAIGGGVGIERSLDAKNMGIPLFIHLRSDLMDNAVSPYLSTDIGYAAEVYGLNHMPESGIPEIDYKVQGLFARVGFGVSYNVGKKYRMTTGLYFRIQNIHMDIGENTIDKSYVGLGAGFCF